jgi:hypothetical protein
MADGNTIDSPSLSVDFQLNPKEQLDELLNRRAVLEENLNALERQIYAFEGNYLEDTHVSGNVVIGFDNYLTSSTHGLSGGRGRQANAASERRQVVQESHRIFSNSSSTYMKALGIKEDASNVATSSIRMDLASGKIKHAMMDRTIWKRGRKRIRQRPKIPQKSVTNHTEFKESAHTATIEPAGPRKLRLKLTSNNYILSRNSP